MIRPMRPPALCSLLLLLTTVVASLPQTSAAYASAPRGRIVGGEGWVPPAERRLAGRLKGAAGTWVEFSRDGKRIATAGGGEARVWDGSTFKPLTKPLRHGGKDRGKGVAIRSAGLSPDGTKLVTGGSDGAAVVWDAATGKRLLTLKHSYEVWSAAFSPDGSKLITADPAERAARVWDVATGRPLQSLKHAHGVWSAAYSRDGGTVLTLTRDDLGRLHAHAWAAATARRLRSVEGGNQRFRRPAALSPDGKRLVVARADDTAGVWDVAGGRLVCETKVAGDAALLGPTTAVAFGADGRKFLTAVPGRQHEGRSGLPRYIPGYVRVWDATTGKPRSTTLETGDVAEALLSRDGRRVLTAGAYDGTAVWDALAGRALFVIRGRHPREAPAIAFSPDGRRVAAGYWGDGETRVYTVDLPQGAGGAGLLP